VNSDFNLYILKNQINEYSKTACKIIIFQNQLLISFFVKINHISLKKSLIKNGYLNFFYNSI
jgi:hypothetical protein